MAWFAMRFALRDEGLFKVEAETSQDASIAVVNATGERALHRPLSEVQYREQYPGGSMNDLPSLQEVMRGLSGTE